MSEEKIVGNLEKEIKDSGVPVTLSRDLKEIWIAGALTDLPDYVLNSMRKVTQFGYHLVYAWDDIAGNFTYPLFE